MEIKERYAVITIVPQDVLHFLLQLLNMFILFCGLCSGSQLLCSQVLCIVHARCKHSLRITDLAVAHLVVILLTSSIMTHMETISVGCMQQVQCNNKLDSLLMTCIAVIPCKPEDGPAWKHCHASLVGLITSQLISCPFHDICQPFTAEHIGKHDLVHVRRCCNWNGL